MNAYLTILFLVHIGGAIAGIGPTFAFGVLGRMAGEGGERGLAMLDAMNTLTWKVVTPVALVTQPLSGALLIFETGRNEDFFSHHWLYTAILLYAIVLYASYFVSAPHIRKMITMAKEGRANSEEFMKLAKFENTMGPIFGVLTVAIIVLMIWKPGD